MQLHDAEQPLPSFDPSLLPRSAEKESDLVVEIDER